MAKQPPTAEELMATLPAVVPPDGSGGLTSVQQRLLALQLKQLERTLHEEEEADSIAKEARAQGAKAMLERHNRDEETKRICPHMKPNFQTAVSGQRDHQHVTHYICAYCAQTFTNKTLQPHLWPPSDRIGGPNQ